MNPEDERPQTDLVRLGNPQEFCQAILDDVEFHFRKRFGPKWTPELQAFFQELRMSCMLAARKADSSIEPAAILPLRQAVILTNGTLRS